MLDVKLTPNDSYGTRSKAITVVPGKKYSIKLKVLGISGKPFSAFFGIVLLTNEEKPMGKRIRWLNDFSGKEREYEILFKVPEGCQLVRMIYRINKETPEASECEYRITPLNDVILSEAHPEAKENYEIPKRFKVLQATEELSPEQEDALEKNIVWIFANPRSGTTWLGTQLLSYNTYSMDEPLIGKHLGELHNIKNELQRYIDVYDEKADYFFNNQYAPVWKYYLRKLILNRIYAQFKDLSHRIIIKEPNGSNVSEILSQCLPNSRAIILLRDGRDNVDSKLDSLIKGGWGTKFVTSISKEQERIAIITRQSKLWTITTNFILGAYAKHRQDRRVIIRYEDLLANTFDMLKQLYKFIDVPIPDDKLKELVDKYSFENIPESRKGSGKFHRAATPGLWKQNFSSNEVEIMDKVMGSLLQKLGYLDGKLEPFEKITLQLNHSSNSEIPIPMISSPLLSAEQEDIVERNLVWIFANPRSGAEWLANLLASSSTQTIHEPLIGKHLGELHESSSGLLRQLEAHSKRSGYIFNTNYSLAWQRGLRKLILNRIYAQFKDLSHRIIITEPNGSLGADIIADSLPNSKIIALVIDGRDAVESEVRESGAAERILQRIRSNEKRDSVFLQKCTTWAATTEFIIKAYENHGKEHSMLVRYEDLVASNSFDLLKKLYQFVGITITDEELKKVMDQHRNAKDKIDIEGGRWARELDEDRKRKMNEIMGPTLRKAGYVG